MICLQDYPDRFPNLFSQIMSYLNQNNQLSIYTGLLGLFALCGRFEFEMDEDRIPLYEIIKGSFEKLGMLVNEMV